MILVRLLFCLWCIADQRDSYKIFTALHGMQTRSSDKNSVCPSVWQTRGLWQNGRKISPDFFIPYERSFSLVFLQEWLVGGNSFYLKFLVNRPPLREIADFRSIFARSASSATPSETVQLALIGSPLRSFQWAQDEHRTLSPRPPKGLKTQCPKFEQ